MYIGTKCLEQTALENCSPLPLSRWVTTSNSICKFLGTSNACKWQISFTQVFLATCVTCWQASCDRQTDGWTDWQSSLMAGQKVNGWVGRWIYGWMNGCMHACIIISNICMSEEVFKHWTMCGEIKHKCLKCYGDYRGVSWHKTSSKEHLCWTSRRFHFQENLNCYVNKWATLKPDLVDNNWNTRNNNSAKITQFLWSQHGQKPDYVEKTLLSVRLTTNHFTCQNLGSDLGHTN